MVFLLVIVFLFYSWKLKIVITSIAIEIFLQAFLIYSSAYLWGAIEETDDATDRLFLLEQIQKQRVATWYEKSEGSNDIAVSSGKQ